MNSLLQLMGKFFFYGDGTLTVLYYQKKDIAVLIFHGITGHSGAYNIAGETISAGLYSICKKTSISALHLHQKLLIPTWWDE